MLEALTKGYITPEDVITWLVLMFLFMIAIGKIWPAIRSKVRKDETIESVPTQIRKVNARVDKVEEKLDRDYESINEIKKELRRQGKENEDSLEERQLLMSSMLAVLDGLQQLGTNGKTKEAQDELQTYINRKAHTSHGTTTNQEAQ
jgi:predicted  nucleic acid-binding Zn-ribbon protein